jgi:SMC interacting uncharacterized protein involved in chromosome segregation
MSKENRRVTRLEESQITGRELDQDFDQVFMEIDELKVTVQQLQTNADRRFDELDRRFDELDRKFAIVMNHITGNGNAGS